MIRGLWIDDPPGLALRDDYQERLAALRLDELAVMVDGPGPGLDDARWTPRQLEQLATISRAPLVLTYWGSPDRVALEALRSRLPDYVRAAGARAAELDLEGPWDHRRVRGYSSLEQAADALGEAVRRSGAQYEVTTFPSRLRTVLSALAHADRLLLQVYPVSSRGGQPIRYDGELGPVHWPREALEQARRRIAQVAPACEVALGLPLYRQAWPGVEIEGALGEALRSGLAAGVARARWWSSKWIVGAQTLGSLGARRRGAARAAWLRSLADASLAAAAR